MPKLKLKPVEFEQKLYRQVPLNHYFMFPESNDVWTKVSPQKIRKIGLTEIVKHSKNVPVLLIGDLDRVIEISDI